MKSLTINNIDKTAPTATIHYDITDRTNQNVTVEITPNEEATILNNNGSNAYIFTENGVFIFELKDKAGNIGYVETKVSWIDKTVPEARINYNISNLTNQNVIAEIVSDEQITVINNNNKTTYEFSENGEFTFEYQDDLGNKGYITARVSWIDKTLPNGILSYNIMTNTNQDVIVSITFDKEDVVVLNNNGSNTYTFTENGEFMFEYQDKAGNKGTISAKVDWIQKEKPIAKIIYNITELTNQDVIATIELKEGVVVTNNNNSNTYTFAENGEFTFEYQDKAGNKGMITAKVDWIDKVIPKATIVYDKTDKTTENVTAMITFDKENVVIINNNGSNTYTFTENGEFTFEYQDKAGNIGTITTSVTWIEKKAEKPIIIPEKKPEEQIIIKDNPIYDYNNQENKTKYTDYTIPNIKLSILTSDILENTTLKRTDLILNENLKQKFGSTSEYFELHIEDEMGAKKAINIENIKMILNIDAEKDFQGIYLVKIDNTFEKINYKKLSNNQIEIEIKDFEKLLLSYKEKEVQTDSEIINEYEQDQNQNLKWIIATIIVLSLGFGIVIWKKNPNKK